METLRRSFISVFYNENDEVTLAIGKNDGLVKLPSIESVSIPVDEVRVIAQALIAVIDDFEDGMLTSGEIRS